MEDVVEGKEEGLDEIGEDLEDCDEEEEEKRWEWEDQVLDEESDRVIDCVGVERAES